MIGEHSSWFSLHLSLVAHKAGVHPGLHSFKQLVVWLGWWLRGNFIINYGRNQERERERDFFSSETNCWLATDVTAAMLGDNNKALSSAGN